jgi:3-oxoacyl-(acyl-carrier-protein) synthase/acyl carrier protein/SAM-dependent methyltransferase
LTSVLDFGCGHGTDVIQIGELFPHVQAHGCTITRDQAILGNRRIAARNLDPSRVRIHHQDSSKVPFPSRYDLIFGVEVSFHIRDKAGLFDNLCRSLNEHGRIVLADYVSNLHGAVQDPNVEISIPTQREWARLMSQFQLKIDEIIDVSPEIANFLYDPNLREHIANLPEVTRKTLTNYANQSASLERGWLSYVLIKLKRNAGWSREQLESHNLQRIQDPTPYPVALEAMRRQQHVDYPPRRVATNASSPRVPEHRVSNKRAVGSSWTSPHELTGVPGPGELQLQLKTILGSVLGLDPSTIDMDQSFVEIGLDSFLGVEFVIAINKKYGTELSNIKVFDYPTLRELSSYLQEEIRKSRAQSEEATTVTTAKPFTAATRPSPDLKKKARAGRTTPSGRTLSEDKVAIIGMSGRYPKANDLGAYWKNLAEGRNCIVEVPPSRWDVNRYYDPDPAREDSTNSKWLGALDDIDCFDPLFFRISPQEAEYMDPQHRLFLQEGYRAFEDAGYAGNALSNRKCGVYLGISTNEYASLLLRNGVLSAPVTSNSYAIAAARIAYYLNLKGPALSVDTACSSSLVAIHLACQALLNGETDMALAGGVTLWLTPESYLAMSRAGMLSSVGQCKTFDDTADGIVVGEGVGALVLKRLKDAQKDGDFIYGVLLGSGINQDGRTNGITAPSVNSQMELERAIYSRHGIDPETISYVETHGTGTRLGDPIELEALATVFREKTGRKNFCALGAVKSNIGHTTAAAGVAGVQKVLLSMRHRTLVPSLNVTKENTRFDFDNSPFYVSRKTTPWDVAPGSRRRAAVSSFGFSGTNAHLVIEEYVPVEPVIPAGERPCLVPLSARTEEQLRQKSWDLLEAVRTAQSPLDLAAVAYTLQAGREAMEERVGFIVSSVGQLVERLSAYVAGEKKIEGARQGRVDAGAENTAVTERDDDLQKLLDLWVSGANVDWTGLYGDAKPRRIPLPAYPFARERYWIDDRTPSLNLDAEFAAEGSLKSLEEIINRIDDDTIDTEQAVEALRTLV